MNVPKSFFCLVKPVTLIIVLVVAVSCKSDKSYKQKTVDGVRITTNSSQPSKPDLKIIVENADSCKTVLSAKMKPEDSLKSTAITLKLHKSITFESDSNFVVNFDQYLEWNGSNRYYLADSKSKKIAVFDESGKRLNVFGGKGQGPGEFIQQGSPVYWQDTLFVPDSKTYKINKFDQNGSFICSKQHFDQSIHFPSYIQNTSSKLMLVNRNGTKLVDGKLTSFYDLLIYDRNFNFISSLYTISNAAELRIANLDRVVPYACLNIDNTIYLFKGSKDKYEIEHISAQGIKLGIICKDYRKHFYPDSLIAKWSKSYNLKYQGNTRDAVEKILSDGKGRLWVRSPGEEQFGEEGYDVFVDGIFMQRVKLLPEMLNGFRFVGNYLLTFHDTRAKIYNVQ